MTKTSTSKRWALVNTRTGSTKRAFATRDLARAAKSGNYKIFDTVNGIYVR